MGSEARLQLLHLTGDGAVAAAFAACSCSVSTCVQTRPQAAVPAKNCSAFAGISPSQDVMPE